MASVIDRIAGDLAGRRAYRTHALGNRLLDAGRSEAAGQRLDRAMALYTEALRRGCDRTDVLMAYSLLLMRYGRLDEARETMLALSRRAGLSAADSRQLRINYAVCQWKLGELDRAIELMKQAGAGGMTGTIYSALGLFLVEKAAQTGDFAEASEFCARALDYDDEDADALDNAGQLHLRRSEQAARTGDAATAAAERGQAAEYFERALGRGPKLVTSLYYRAQLLHEDGEDARAAELLRRAQSAQAGMLCPVSREQIDALLREVEG